MMPVRNASWKQVVLKEMVGTKDTKVIYNEIMSNSIHSSSDSGEVHITIKTHVFKLDFKYLFEIWLYKLAFLCLSSICSPTITITANYNTVYITRRPV